MNKKEDLDERLELLTGKKMIDLLVERFPESDEENEFVLYQFIIFIRKVERENNERAHVLHVSNLWMKRYMDC